MSFAKKYGRDASYLRDILSIGRFNVLLSDTSISSFSSIALKGETDKIEETYLPLLRESKIICLLIPSYIDIDRLSDKLREYALLNMRRKNKAMRSFLRSSSYRDFILYFVSLLSIKRHENHKYIDPDDILTLDVQYSAVHLHSEVLRKISAYIIEARRILKHAGLLYVSKSYKNGEFSKKYMLLRENIENFIGTSNTCASENYKRAFIYNRKSVRLFTKKFKRAHAIANSGGYFQTKISGILENELMKGKNEIVQKYRQKIERFKIDEIEAKQYAENQKIIGDISNEKYQHIINSIDKIAKGEIYASYDNFANRVHTNLTNMKKSYRSFLYIDEKYDLSEIDIKNSQILMLSIAMKVMRDRFNYLFLPNDIYTPISRIAMDWNGSSLESMEKFSNDCEAGTIYENLSKYYEEEYGEEIDRKKMKKMMFLYLFYPLQKLCQVKDKKTKKIDMKRTREIIEAVRDGTFDILSFKKISKIGNILKKHYLSAFVFIEKMRSSRYDDREIARLLQKIEVYIFIDSIEKTVPNKIYGTIHDSILCKTEDVPIFIEAIRNSFHRYSTNVSLSIKELMPEYL